MCRLFAIARPHSWYREHIDFWLLRERRRRRNLNTLKTLSGTGYKNNIKYVVELTPLSAGPIETARSSQPTGPKGYQSIF
jgi:hypothetical protein